MAPLKRKNEKGNNSSLYLTIRIEDSKGNIVYVRKNSEYSKAMKSLKEFEENWKP